MTFLFLFINSHKRLRSGWRLIVFVGLFLLQATISSTLIETVFVIFNASPEKTMTRAMGFVLSSLVLLFAAVLIGWICAKGFENLPFRSLGWSFVSGWWRDLSFGILFGTVFLLLTAGIAALGGGLKFTFNQTANLNLIGNTVLLSAVVFAFGAAGEEALFRGYAVQTLTRARLSWLAILLTSIFFAAVHADNPNANVFGLINTVLAGVWFVAAYLKTRSLWFPFGMHWAWNWTMAAILGLPVSGITQLTPEPVWRSIDTGPVWLTGGHYGLEGGAACTISLIISTILIWFVPFIKPNAEMLALTNQENPVALPADLPPSSSIFKN